MVNGTIKLLLGGTISLNYHSAFLFAKFLMPSLKGVKGNLAKVKLNSRLKHSWTNPKHQMEQEKGYDYLFKILLVGDAGVGKSMLMMRVADDLFIDLHATTFGVDFRISCRSLFGSKIKLQIWDPQPPDHRNHSIKPSYYRGAHGLMILYEAHDPKALSDVKDWLEQSDRYACEDINRLIVACKCDLECNKVENDLVQKFAKEHGINWIETSSKDSHNIEECFILLVHEILLRVNKPIVPLASRRG